MSRAFRLLQRNKQRGQKMFRTHSRTVRQTGFESFSKAGNAFMTLVGFNNSKKDNND